LPAIEPVKAPAIDLMVGGPGGNIEAAHLSNSEAAEIPAR
jgi:hypothetical protein